MPPKVKVAVIVIGWFFIFLGQQRGPFKDLETCERIKTQLVSMYPQPKPGYGAPLKATDCWDGGQ